MNYHYIDAVESGNNIHLWLRDMDGKLIEQKIPTSKYLYAYVRDNTGSPDMQDIYGNPMKKVSFEDKWEFRKWCKTATNLCESDIAPVYKMFPDLFVDAPRNAPVNVLFYDIEVDFDLDDGLGYPTPKNPHGEINSFQAFDTFLNRYVFILNEKFKDTVILQDKDYPIDIYYVRNERELIKTISEVIDHVDIMTAWFGAGFDLPYIIERAIHHFGEKEALTMLCRGGFPAKRREFYNDFGEDVWEWTLVGRHHLDMMVLYKKFIPGEKESFGLGSVCEVDLGETKDEYDGDLGSLYRENPQAFFNYALQDARLLKMLDDKHQIIKLAIMMARMSCVKFGDVTGSVKPIESGIAIFAHKRGIVLPDKKDNEKEKFPGAIVYDTIPGRHGWVFTIDLNSLYPSVMRMLGLSPETLVMQLLGEYEDYIKVMTKQHVPVRVYLEREKEEITVMADELEQIIRESGYCIAASGAIFDGRMGLLAEYVEDLVFSRKKYQKLMKEAASDNNFLLSETYDLYQKVMKLCANSSYGVTGEKSFRLYDLRLSKAITLTARVVSKWQAWKSNHELNKLAQ